MSTVLRVSPTKVIVPNKLLKQRFIHLRETKGLTASEVAERLGWYQRRPQSGKTPFGDGERVKRRLGLAPMYSGGKVSYQTGIESTTAKALAEALDILPTEAGF